MSAVGIDIGGTRIKAGRVSPAGDVTDPRVVDTPQRADDIVQAVASLIGQYQSEHAVSQLGVAVAAFLTVQRDRIELSPNIDWQDRPLRQELSHLTGSPVVLENDANAAGYAEARLGAGRGASPMVMFTLGTGVGGAVVIDGEILIGSRGLAGELGHLIVEPGGAVCGCGQRGCLETVSSGTAMMNHLRLEHGVQVESPEQLAETLSGSSELLESVVERVAWGLVQGVLQVHAVIDPAVVVIGGGVAERLGERLIDAVDRERGKVCRDRRSEAFPEIRLAQVGNQAGVVGAALLAMTQPQEADQ